MPEVALPVPLDSNEIIEIACQEFRKRLQSLSPLQLGKEYAGFAISFTDKISIFRLGASGGNTVETTAWGGSVGGVPVGDPVELTPAPETYKSGDSVNDVRLAHNLQLTVESGDGKGGRVRKKVRVKE